MDGEAVLDSVKTYVTDRLKNPYMASVIAAWLIINRIVVFGLFNFENSLTVEQRVTWIHQQFKRFEVWEFHGLLVVTFYSIIGGVVAMFLFNKINLYGKVLFNWFNKSSVNILQKMEPAKWVKEKVYTRLLNDFDSQATELETKKGDLRGWEEKINEYNRLTKKFRILYAQYFTTEKEAVVTDKLLSLATDNGLDVIANNENFGDPHVGTIKKLQVIYQINGIVYSETVLEGEHLLLGEQEQESTTWPR